MHILDGRLRLATLVVKLINEDVKDADIPKYLASAADPFTNQPATWDPKDRKIYFPDPTDRCAIVSWFRVRDPKQGRVTPSSLINMSAC